VAYVNNYYFYLQKLDFSALSTSISHRNIAMEVKVLDNDSDPSQKGMQVIYAGTAGIGEMTEAYTSAVWYHQETPKHFDEIAIKLPIQVNEKHHLLITYYHINCKPPKSSGKNEEQTTVIAYSFIKLLKDHQYVAN